MENTNVLHLLSVLAIILLSQSTVLARRSYDEQGWYHSSGIRNRNDNDGSGYNEDDSFGSGDSPGFDDDRGSGDYYINGRVNPHWGEKPTRAPDWDIMVDRTQHPRTTASIYIHGGRVEIGRVDDGDSGSDVKKEAIFDLLTHPAVLAAIIIGVVFIILFVALLIMFVVYRMRKKDEGSYILDDPKTMSVGLDHHQLPQASSVIYMKAPTNDREFYA